MLETEGIVGRDREKDQRWGGGERSREILSTATSTQMPNHEITKTNMRHKQTTQ